VPPDDKTKPTAPAIAPASAPPATTPATKAPTVDQQAAEFLQKVKKLGSAKAALEAITKPAGRIIFAMDATSSREPSWELARNLQLDMFQAAAGLESRLSSQLPNSRNNPDPTGAGTNTQKVGKLGITRAAQDRHEQEQVRTLVDRHKAAVMGKAKFTADTTGAGFVAALARRVSAGNPFALRYLRGIEHQDASARAALKKLGTELWAVTRLNQIEAEKRAAFEARRKGRATVVQEDATPQAVTPKPDKPDTPDCWFTPKAVMDALHEVLGPAALDSASPPQPVHVRAQRYYSEADDGLSQPWHCGDGWLFLNPPWDQTGEWIDKLHSERRAGNVKCAVIIMPNKRSGAYDSLRHIAHQPGAPQIRERSQHSPR
jgi:hypothetical protein